MSTQEFKPQNNDIHARDAFSFRRMKKWQLWGVSAFVVVAAVVLFSYVW